MIECHWVFRANFTRGQDWVTNWKIPLQSSLCICIPFPPCPLLPVLTHLFFPQCYFSFSLPHFCTYECLPFRKPINVDTSTLFSVSYTYTLIFHYLLSHLYSFLYSLSMKFMHILLLIILLNLFIFSSSSAAISYLLTYFHLLIST